MSTHRQAGLLDTDSVGEYLVDLGMLTESPESVETLSGGVSSRVLAIRASGRRLVVKQALARLAVAEEWTAPVSRVLNEGAAMAEFGRLTPDAVPALYASDPERNAIVIELAPDGWTDWKSQLLRGTVKPAVADRLGRTLGSWHSGTTGRLDPVFDDAEIFRVLRLDPYHRTVAERIPEVADAIDLLIDELTNRRPCLVHGDFSPKNVLVGVDGSWIIDFEVAHRGNPVFDVAFMLSHLVLKSLHRPTGALSYDACASAFTDAYRDSVSPGMRSDDSTIAAHVGALLLARVVGKSPVEYLDGEGRARARALGLSLLLSPPERLADIRIRRENTRP